jgi:outer membrane receptor for ferrienterochelin and colicin
LEKGLISFLNFRYLKDERDSGQIDHHKNNGNFSSDYWGAQVQTDRLDFSTKFGYVNPNIPYQSLGVQLAYSYHNQDSYFGERAYDIQHNSVYTNLVYNSIISDSRHKIKTGLGFTFDSYYEFFMANKYSRKEHSTGGFFEYNYDNYDNLNLTLGFRLDSHNLLGFFATPRLHVRYTPWNRAALRFSVGRGKRSANVFAENQNYLASSRSFQFLNSDGPIYGLDPEIAWNYGISFMQGFNLFGRSADIVVDFYKTDFENQVVVDAENPYELRFYNLQGKSYANSLQLDFNMSPLERLNFKSAFKYYDVKVDYINGRLEKPMTARQRFFTNISYESISNSSAQLWRFDATFNRIGRQRFPSTSLSPEEYKRPDYAPAFSTLNAQLTRVFSNKFELYLGGENITDTRQKNPIISAENPFGPNFDSTFVYGPVFGKSFYLGLRFKI